MPPDPNSADLAKQAQHIQQVREAFLAQVRLQHYLKTQHTPCASMHTVALLCMHCTKLPARQPPCLCSLQHQSVPDFHSIATCLDLAMTTQYSQRMAIMSIFDGPVLRAHPPTSHVSADASRTVPLSYPPTIQPPASEFSHSHPRRPTPAGCGGGDCGPAGGAALPPPAHAGGGSGDGAAGDHVPQVGRS